MCFYVLYIIFPLCNYNIAKGQPFFIISATTREKKFFERHFKLFIVTLIIAAKRNIINLIQLTVLVKQ